MSPTHVYSRHVIVVKGALSPVLFGRYKHLLFGDNNSRSRQHYTIPAPNAARRLRQTKTNLHMYPVPPVGVQWGHTTAGGECRSPFFKVSWKDHGTHCSHASTMAGGTTEVPLNDSGSTIDYEVSPKVPWKCVHRASMVFPRGIEWGYGIYMGLPWNLHGIIALPWSFHGASMELPFSIHGTSMPSAMLPCSG